MMKKTLKQQLPRQPRPECRLISHDSHTSWRGWNRGRAVCWAGHLREEAWPISGTFCSCCSPLGSSEQSSLVLLPLGSQSTPLPLCFPCAPSTALPFLQAAPEDFSSALMFLMSPWRVCCHFKVAYLGVLVLNEAGKDEPHKPLVHHLIHGLCADICRDRSESESCPAPLQHWEMICHFLKGDLEFGNKCHKLYVYILTLGDLSSNKELDTI